MAYNAIYNTFISLSKLCCGFNAYRNSGPYSRDPFRQSKAEFSKQAAVAH